MKNLSNKQNEIMNAAIGLISQGGIQALSMRSISEKIGISEPAIYRHFKSKLEILLSILDHFESLSLELFKELEKIESSNLDKLKLLFLNRCKQFSENPELAKVIFAEEIFQNEEILSKKVTSIMHLNHKKIGEILEKAKLNKEIRNDIETNHLIVLVLGALRLLVTKWRLSNFNFDLISESINIWNSINKVLKGN